MLISTGLLQSTVTLTSPFQPLVDTHFRNSPSSAAPCLPKSLLPGFDAGGGGLLSGLLYSGRRPHRSKKLSAVTTAVNASLIEAPLLWAGRLCVFYALLKAGLAGSDANPLVSDLGSSGVSAEYGDLGFSKWLGSLQGKQSDKEAADRRKLVSKWHPTTKGTLRRNYRIPSKSEGRRLLKAIASLLSDDDHFTDATSHKGCQIRRESAHGESVCCNNVRALFDELPTPHVIVEITPFPAGPLTEKDYAKAEKLERVLRSGPSI
ncbi:uncharacterized protein LOC116201939 [Punica granatum]|uniref:Uncharacterized protein n=2 Tax=Punica granatum TaxID=22663 RepID=A0A218WME5_PUNGR|nr:uncharacterized protein LOC116201939 [Punica granatum]OWM73411.1 hypothetical protein CDL15_Pgr026510 [Punica granatum]PKI43156.1 hypothetical protein CRG98_036462 [Punica granatum]